MLIKASELTKKYDRGNHEFLAVNNVNLNVGQGDFICITGRSGSGKSTLLNMLAGLIKPTQGQIVFEGKEYSSLNDNILTNLRNSKIGYIPQGSSVLSNFSVLDNVRLPFYLFKREGDVTGRAKELLNEMGISHLSSVNPTRLSGGELRRVSIARALINKPELLLADEPTVDLDTQTTKEIMQLFSKISMQGTTILMVTHELDLQQYANRSIRMDDGKIMEVDG